jgi:uncharacterized membrane protein
LSIQTNRTLGGIGACLTVASAVGGISSLIQYAYPNLAATNPVYSIVSVFGSLGFVGFILFLIAMFGFSKAYGEKRIFSYLLWGIIITIIAAVITVAIFVAVLFVNLSSIIQSFNPSNPSQTQIISIMLTYLAPLLAVFGFVSLINVLFTVKVFNLLATKSEVPLFRGAAKVLLAGASLTIVLGIVFTLLASSGLASLNTLLIVDSWRIMQDIAWVLLAFAFFRIRVQQPKLLHHPMFQLMIQVKYYSNCGTITKLMLPTAHDAVKFLK